MMNRLIEMARALKRAAEELEKGRNHLSVIISEQKKESATVKCEGLSQHMGNIDVHETDMGEAEEKEDMELRRSYQCPTICESDTSDDNILDFEENETLEIITEKSKETLKNEKEEITDLCFNYSKEMESMLMMCNKSETEQSSIQFEKVPDEDKVFNFVENPVLNDTKETNIKKKEPKGSKIIKGQEFQHEVERIANNHNYFVQKSNSNMASFEKENVVISCFFKHGTVNVKVKGVLIGHPFKNCTVNLLNSIFNNPKDRRNLKEKIMCKPSFQYENRQTVDNGTKETDCITEMKTLNGEDIQLKVEQAAKNRGFCIHKSEPSIVILKKENVTVTWYSNGTVRIQGSGITSLPYKPCSGHQFIKILDNPHTSNLDNPKVPIQPTEINEISALNNTMVINESKQPKQDIFHNNNSKITKDPSNIAEVQLKNTNTLPNKPAWESYASRCFAERHFDGHHNPDKPVNSKVSKEELNEKGLMILRESGKPGVDTTGARHGQKLFVTKVKVSYENTGVHKNGETGKAHFVMAGKHNPEDKTVVPEHLGGQAKSLEDNHMEYGGVLYSQCESQATQHLPE